MNSMKHFIMVAAFSGTLSAGGAAANAQPNEVAPFIECKDKHDPELLISISPDQGLFIYDKSEVLGLASKTAFALRLARSADSMTLKAAANNACKFVDADATIGIESVTCSLKNGAQIKLKPTDAPEKIVTIRSGSVHFYANMYYEGQAYLTLDLVTADGQHVIVRKDMDRRSCNTDNLSRSL